MERTLKSFIKSDLEDKIVLLSGPRQTGKTTLSRQLFSAYDYFNYDAPEDRVALKERSWDRDKPLVIFDELHKMSGWKRWLKGIYDTEGIKPKLLVTGSARMDTYRKVGDSLAGRFFSYRMHPLDMKEAAMQLGWSCDDIFERLWHCSGFPEPFLKGEATYYKRWQRSHLDTMLRQDLLELYSVRDIQSIETLVQLLKRNVGSAVSYASLARDLQRDATTIKRWLSVLESLYIIFAVRPYHRNVARALLKEPKYYFYDWMHAATEGGKLENIVASALLKEIHFLEDTQGQSGELHYVRTKEGKELDFLVRQQGEPTHLIEVKKTDAQPSPHFAHFTNYIEAEHRIQLVANISRNKTYPSGVAIKHLKRWLQTLSLSSAA